MNWPLYSKPSCGGDENQLGRFQRLGDRDGDAIGIHAIRFAIAIEPSGGTTGMMP